MNCRHCGYQREASYCWSCGPTTEDMKMGDITQEILENWFTYHPPVGDQQERYALVNKASRDFAQLIFDRVKPGPDRDAALLTLRRLRMDVNLAIACENGPTAP